MEEQIVLHYAIPDMHRKADFGLREKAKDSKQIDWDKVINLALLHDVFPSIYSNLKNTNWPMAPQGAIMRFRKIWREHLARNIIFVNELDRILTLFANEGVRAVPLKGAILGGLFYSDVSLRAFNDLDIWVRLEDMEKARELLQQLGFRPEMHVDERKPAENSFHIMFYRYFPNGARISVELHWHLFKTRDYASIPERHWWQCVCSVLINDQLYYTLAPEDMFIYLTTNIHTSKYLYLKQFVDLYQFIICYNEKLNWEYIRQTAKQAGVLNNCFFAFLITQNLFGTYMPQSKLGRWEWPTSKPFRFHVLCRIFNQKTILLGKYGCDLRYGFCLLLNDRLRDSINSILRIIFPSPASIAYRYFLLPYSKKVCLYYFLHPFLSIYRLFRSFVMKSWEGNGLREQSKLVGHR